MSYLPHDQVEAMTLADRILVLQAGRIEQIGAPLVLYNHLDNLFVATFIGSPKMNVIPARVVSISGQEVALTFGKGRSLVLALPGARLAAGDGVTLGVRSEHCDATPDGETDLDTIVA